MRRGWARRPARITRARHRSRWGSCSSARLAVIFLAADLRARFVRDYVVAHEVAHLKEMNHWPALLGACEDPVARHARRARQWLRDHGRDLLRYN